MEDNKTPAMSVIIPKIITATLSEIGKKKVFGYNSRDQKKDFLF